MVDAVVSVLDDLVPGGVVQGEMTRGDRVLRWVEAGSGDPVVVLDAGLAEPGPLAWAPVIAELATVTQVVAYDRAGIGSSDPAMPLNLDSELQDLAALIGRMGPGRVIVVGHSWGGLLAQLVAFSHPDQIAGLVLVDPAHEEVFAQIPLGLRAVDSLTGWFVEGLYLVGLLGPVLRRTYRPFARRVTDDEQTCARFLDAYVASYGLRRQARMYRTENRLARRSIPQMRQLRSRSVLPDVPVVVMSATRGAPRSIRDRWTSLQADLVRDTNGRHFEVPGVGHAIHQEQPGTVASIVADTIKDLRASGAAQSARAWTT
ncbi:MAG: alpha/beta hydrolase [Actinomycetes bacterium]